MKLNEWLDIWLNKYTKYSLKLRTYNLYLNICDKHIKPVLGENSLKTNRYIDLKFRENNNR